MCPNDKTRAAPPVHANGPALLQSPSLARGSKQLNHCSRARLPLSCSTDKGSNVEASHLPPCRLWWCCWH